MGAAEKAWPDWAHASRAKRMKMAGLLKAAETIANRLTLCAKARP